MQRGEAGDHIGAVKFVEMEVGKLATNLEIFPPAVCASTGTEMA